MKKIFLLSIVSLLFLSVSCEQDESLDPRPIITSGAYVRLDIKQKRLNFDDISNTSFGGTLTAPGNQVSKYNLYIRRTDQFGNAYGDFKLIRTITAFPIQLSITPAEIADALEIPLSDLGFADVYRFRGEAFDLAGTKIDFYNLSQTIQSNQAFYKQAFRFNTDMTNNDGMVGLELADYNNYLPQ